MNIRQVTIAGIFSVLLAAPLASQAATETQQSGASGQSHAQMSAKESRGSIKAVQKKLKEDGYYKGKIDGRWGMQSAGALKAYQKDKDLQATGTLDEKTADKLGLDKSEFSAFEEAVQQGGAKHSGARGMQQSGSQSGSASTKP